MLGFSNEDSEQSLVHSTSTSPDNWSTWWNPSGVLIQKSHILQNLNANPASSVQQCSEINQLEYQKLDCHTYSNKSMSQFHHKASEAREYKLHEHIGQCTSTQSVFYWKGSDNSCCKQVEDLTKPVLSLGTPDAVLQQPKIDYSQPIPCVSYPSADPYSGGVMPAYGSINVICSPVVGMGSSARVPLPLELTDDEPIYVNPKQYNGIMRRRQLRAKLEAQNKLAKERKPYLHESRHLHAMKRARGAGGRFLTKKELQQQSEPTETLNNANGIMLMSISGDRHSFTSSMKPHSAQDMQGWGGPIFNQPLRRLLV